MINIDDQIKNLSEDEFLEFTLKSVAPFLGHSLGQIPNSIESIIYNKKGVFSPIQSALYAILLFLRGKITSCEKSIQIASTYTLWLEKLLVQSNAFIYCFLEQEEKFQQQNFSSIHQVLFQAAKKIANLKINFLQHEIQFSSEDEKNLPLQAIFSYLENCSDSSFNYRKEVVKNNFGINSYFSKPFSVITSACGVNTGLGSIRAAHNHITSFGPHYNPLGEMEKYGIFRQAFSGVESLQDVSVKFEPFRSSAWTKCISSESKLMPSDIWIETSLEEIDDEIHLSVRFENFGENLPISFAFFIQSKKISMLDKSFHQNSLERFRGKSETISCQSKSEILEISAKFDSYMQVIPLAGGDHFWGADFLLAYDIEDLNNQYHWIIKIKD